jgi:hypothetical protein
MPDSVGTALIGAAGAVLGALISATIPKLNEWGVQGKRFSSVPKEIETSIVTGKWSGSGSDTWVEDKSGDLLRFDVQTIFKRKHKKIIGDVRMTVPDTPTADTDLILEGGFYNDSYLQFAYRSTDPVRKQMGVVVLRLMPRGDSMEGHYAGFSPVRAAFVVGKVELHKVV